jgi:hypothetical protein
MRLVEQIAERGDDGSEAIFVQFRERHALGAAVSGDVEFALERRPVGTGDAIQPEQP